MQSAEKHESPVGRLWGSAELAGMMQASLAPQVLVCTGHHSLSRLCSECLLLQLHMTPKVSDALRHRGSCVTAGSGWSSTFQHCNYTYGHAFLKILWSTSARSQLSVQRALCAAKFFCLADLGFLEDMRCGVVRDRG